MLVCVSSGADNMKMTANTGNPKDCFRLIFSFFGFSQSVVDID